ncbi:MAG TPA: hypothetical protein DIV86_05200, partial [Alphaproteobacteria bacterium]|nr:hypothetical protein [Alphaproteobacteria bacterium]
DYFSKEIWLNPLTIQLSEKNFNKFACDYIKTLRDTTFRDGKQSNFDHAVCQIANALGIERYAELGAELMFEYGIILPSPELKGGGSELRPGGLFGENTFDNAQEYNNYLKNAAANYLEKKGGGDIRKGLLQVDEKILEQLGFDKDLVDSYRPNKDLNLDKYAPKDKRWIGRFAKRYFDGDLEQGKQLLFKTYQVAKEKYNGNFEQALEEIKSSDIDKDPKKDIIFLKDYVYDVVGDIGYSALQRGNAGFAYGSPNPLDQLRQLSWYRNNGLTYPSTFQMNNFDGAMEIAPALTAALNDGDREAAERYIRSFKYKNATDEQIKQTLDDVFKGRTKGDNQGIFMNVEMNVSILKLKGKSDEELAEIWAKEAINQIKIHRQYLGEQCDAAGKVTSLKFKDFSGIMSTELAGKVLEKLAEKAKKDAELKTLIDDGKVHFHLHCQSRPTEVHIFGEKVVKQRQDDAHVNFIATAKKLGLSSSVDTSLSAYSDGFSHPNAINLIKNAAARFFGKDLEDEKLNEIFENNPIIKSYRACENYIGHACHHATSVAPYTQEGMDKWNNDPLVFGIAGGGKANFLMKLKDLGYEPIAKKFQLALYTLEGKESVITNLANDINQSLPDDKKINFANPGNNLRSDYHLESLMYILNYNQSSDNVIPPSSKSEKQNCLDGAMKAFGLSEEQVIELAEKYRNDTIKNEHCIRKFQELALSINDEVLYLSGSFGLVTPGSFKHSEVDARLGRFLAENNPMALVENALEGFFTKDTSNPKRSIFDVPAEELALLALKGMKFSQFPGYQNTAKLGEGVRDGYPKFMLGEFGDLPGKKYELDETGEPVSNAFRVHQVTTMPLYKALLKRVPNSLNDFKDIDFENLGSVYDKLKEDPNFLQNFFDTIGKVSKVADNLKDPATDKAVDVRSEIEEIRAVLFESNIRFEEPSHEKALAALKQARDQKLITKKQYNQATNDNNYLGDTLYQKALLDPTVFVKELEIAADVSKMHKSSILKLVVEGMDRKIKLAAGNNASIQHLIAKDILTIQNSTNESISPTTIRAIANIEKILNAVENYTDKIFGKNAPAELVERGLERIKKGLFEYACKTTEREIDITYEEAKNFIDKALPHKKDRGSQVSNPNPNITIKTGAEAWQGSFAKSFRSS